MLILNLILILFLNFVPIYTSDITTSIPFEFNQKNPIYIYDNTKLVDNEICFSSLTQADCATDEIITANGTEFGCPACSSNGVSIRETCSPMEDNECKFGLKCNADDAICDFDRSTCAYTYHIKNLREDESKVDPSKLPTCEIDGTFAAVQCKGDQITGRCFCFSPEGKRIYGWAFWHELKDTEMNCACSRLKYKMEQNGLHGNTLHCDKMGNFEELQCNDGICWCAHKVTGELQNKTRAVPENMWKFLPCYDKKYHSEQYLRQCESIAKAQSTLKKALYAHNTTQIEFNNIMCDYDGSYGPVKNLNGKISCQWTDGETIASYSTTSKNLGKMTCNCPRDQKIFASAGISHRLNCDAFGNYDSVQNINDKVFCIDNDGFATSDAIEVDPKKEIDCKIYSYNDIALKPEEYIDPNGEDSDYLKDSDENYYYE